MENIATVTSASESSDGKRRCRFESALLSSIVHVVLHSRNKNGRAAPTSSVDHSRIIGSDVINASMASTKEVSCPFP